MFVYWLQLKVYNILMLNQTFQYINKITNLLIQSQPQIKGWSISDVVEMNPATKEIFIVG